MRIKEAIDSVNKDLRNTMKKKSKKNIGFGIAAVACLSALAGFLVYVQKKSETATKKTREETVNAIKKIFDDAVDNVMNSAEKAEHGVTEVVENVTSKTKDFKDDFSDGVQKIKEEIEKTVDHVSNH